MDPVDKFRISVDQLQEGPFRAQIDAAPGELELEDAAYTFPGRARAQLEFSLVGHDVRGVGQIEIETAALCSRCLDPVRGRVAAPVDVVWLRQDPEEPERFRPSSESIMAETYWGDFIDARNALREAALSALDPLPYCDPDCKGLCPGCGANLNREPCRCKAAEPSDQSAPEWKRKLQDLARKKPGGAER